MPEQNDSTDTTAETPDSPVYAILVTNDEARILDINPAGALAYQVGDPIADAIPPEDLPDRILVPPDRDLTVTRAAAWGPEDLVIFSLDNALRIATVDKVGLRINYRAWFAYARSPIVGPAVIAHDSDRHGKPVAIPPYVVGEILADLNPHARAGMETILATSPDLADDYLARR